MYGDLQNVKIITLAPELSGASDVIINLTKLGITVSVGELRYLFFYCNYKE